MQTESAKRIGAVLNAGPAMPSTIRTWAESQVASDLVVAQRHPIDTALTEPSSRGGHRAVGILAGSRTPGDGRPIRIGPVHDQEIDAWSRHRGPGAGCAPGIPAIR